MSEVDRSVSPVLECGGHAFPADVEAFPTGGSQHSEQWDVRATAIYAPCEFLKIDGQGRVVLSETARLRAGLSHEGLFEGLGRKFQIWGPTRSVAHLAEAKRRMRARRTDFEAQRTADLVPPMRGARE